MSNSTFPDPAPGPRVDRVVALAAAVAGLAAIVASYRSLAELAAYAGWDGWLIWLLPASIDAYAIAATRVWLARGTAEGARRTARTNAVAAIGASVAGNAVSHAITAGVLPLTWPVVVVVASVPPVVVGLVLHLWQLHSAEPATVASVPAVELAREDQEPEPASDLTGMSKAAAVREALRVLDTTDVPAAVAWLSERGVSVDRSYAYEVANGRASGRRRRTPQEPTSPTEPTTAQQTALVEAA